MTNISEEFCFTAFKFLWSSSCFTNFFKGLKIVHDSLYSLCIRCGMPWVVSGHPTLLTIRRGLRSYIRSECCTGNRLMAAPCANHSLGSTRYRVRGWSDGKCRFSRHRYATIEIRIWSTSICGERSLPGALNSFVSFILIKAPHRACNRRFT